MALEHEVLRPDGPIVGRPWLDQGVVLPTADRGSARLLPPRARRSWWRATSPSFDTRRWRVGCATARLPALWMVGVPGRLRGCLEPSPRPRRSAGGDAARFGAAQTGQRYGGGRARTNVRPSRDRPAGSAPLSSPTRVTAGVGPLEAVWQARRLEALRQRLAPLRPQGDGARRSWGRAGHTEPPYHGRCRRRSAHAG